MAFDGTGSSDPENNVLTFAWSPTDNLNDPSLAQPIYSGIDDAVDSIVELTVYDQIEALHSTAATTVTVVNVPPTVMPSGAILDEGGVATVSAEFTDPGTLDTHTATIDWGDGTPAVPVSIAQLGIGVNHVYGDNGQYFATITDDDGGVGIGIAGVGVNNLDPVVDLDLSDAVSFPGGDYLVVHAGDDLDASAHATDAGSDDLTFTWSVGDVTTYFNNGVAARRWHDDRLPRSDVCRRGDHSQPRVDRCAAARDRAAPRQGAAGRLSASDNRRATKRRLCGLPPRQSRRSRRCDPLMRSLRTASTFT